MKRLSRRLAFTWLLLLCAAMPAGADGQRDRIAAVVARVKPAVVQIITVRPPADPDTPDDTEGAKTAVKAGPVTAIGSGFIIDPKGFIATNKHVVENAVSVSVATADGVRHRARVVGVTYHADIALVQIDPWRGIPVVTFGDSDKAVVGEQVIAIGSPFGFEGSVTTGVVSAVNRDIMESPFDDYIQTDAAINHGNSGGPLFNLAGEVIGMNSILFAPGTVSGSIGLGFAIPSNDLNFVLGRLKAAGHVNAGMLPIRTQPVSWMLARAIGSESLHGALVAGIDDSGDRMLKGLIRPGDVIVSFNGFTVLDPRDLARKAAVALVGSDAELEILRGDQRITVNVTVQPYPEEDPPDTSMAVARELGLRLERVAGQGVTVADVDLSGTASDSGIQKGDVILQVQQEAVTDPSQALRLIQVQTALKRPFASVLVLRDGKPTWIPVAVPE